MNGLREVGVDAERIVKEETDVPLAERCRRVNNICRDTNCPAVLMENFFQDNKEDVAFLLSEEGKRTVTRIHVEGIVNYLES